MSLRRLIFAAGLLFAVCLSVNAFAAEKPHIVLVMADDQGWGDMAYNGHPVIKTPHFDEASRTGLRFDRFYAAAPVCSPTRASVMTGRHPNRSGVFKWGYPLRPQETTIAEAMKTAGYTTAHFGKWHLGSVRKTSPANPGANGFDEWLSAPNFYDNNAILSHKGVAVKTEGESSIVAADAALKWLEDSKAGGKPMFAVVWFGSPHSPHRAVTEDAELYKDKSKALQNFYGEVTGMDRAFGKLRQGLTDLGIRDNTILWYCSDNGALPKVGSTGGLRGNKGKVYEGGLMVPAILEWPAKIKQPRTINARCNTSDIFPTLLELVQGEFKSSVPLDGVSLARVIDGKQDARGQGMGFWDYNTRGISTPSAQWMGELLKAQQAGKDLPPHPSSANAAKLPSPAYSTSSFPGHSAWIEGDWKLHRMQNGDKPPVFELYNLAEDRSETTNLLKSEPKRVTTMQKNLEAWLRSVVNSLNGKDYRS